MQSLDPGCSLVETLETVNGCSLVPLTCEGVSPVRVHLGGKETSRFV